MSYKAVIPISEDLTITIEGSRWPTSTENLKEPKMSKREKAKSAAKRILGDECFQAMMNSRISVPQILDSAGLKAFMENLSGSHIEDLREGLNVLHKTGVLE